MQKKILDYLRGEPRRLHDVVLHVFPTLEEKPREVAQCGVNYVRYLTGGLVSHGLLDVNSNGLLGWSERMNRRNSMRLN